MALSPDCIEQHQKEQAISRKWLCWGMVCAAGLHGALIPVFSLRLQSVEGVDAVEPVEMIVVAVGEGEGEGIPLESEVEQAEEAGGAGRAGEEITEELTEAEDADQPEAAKESDEVEQTESSEASEDSEVAEAAEESEDLETTEAAEAAEESQNSDTEEDTDGVETAEKLEATEAVDGTENTQTVGQSEKLETVENSNNESVESEAAGSGSTDGSTTADGRLGDNTGARENGPETAVTTEFGCRSCFRPAYPEAAKLARAEGAPRVSYDIDSDGNVIRVSLAASSGNAALDTAALEAVQQFKFTAGHQGRTRILQIDFSLEGSERNREAQRQGERLTVQEADEPTSQPNDSAVDNGAPVSVAEPEPIDQEPETIPEAVETPVSDDSSEAGTSSTNDATTLPTDAPEVGSESEVVAPEPVLTPEPETPVIDRSANP